MPMDSQQSAVPPEFTLKRIVRFGSIASAILLSVNALVCATWSYFFGIPGWIAWQVLPGAVAVAFIPTTILRFRFNHPALRIIYAMTSAWLGALNFAFFAAVGCWIVEAIAWATAFPFPRSSIAAVLFGVALVATAYGAGLALIVDEFALLLDLSDVYWAKQGRQSVDLAVGLISTTGTVLVGMPVIRRLRREGKG